MHGLRALQGRPAGVLAGRQLIAASPQVCRPGPGRRPGRPAGSCRTGVTGPGWLGGVRLDPPLLARVDAAQRGTEIRTPVGEHADHARVAAVHGGEPGRHDRGLPGDGLDDTVMRPGCLLQPGEILKVAAQGRRAELLQRDVPDHRGQPGRGDGAHRRPGDPGELAERRLIDALPGHGVDPYPARLSHGPPHLTPAP